MVNNIRFFSRKTTKKTIAWTKCNLNDENCSIYGRSAERQKFTEIFSAEIRIRMSSFSLLLRNVKFFQKYTRRKFVVSSTTSADCWQLINWKTFSYIAFRPLLKLFPVIFRRLADQLSKQTETVAKENSTDKTILVHPIRSNFLGARTHAYMRVYVIDARLCRTCHWLNLLLSLLQGFQYCRRMENSSQRNKFIFSFVLMTQR